MNLLFSICVSLSFGVILGFLIGGIKQKFSKKTYSKKQIEFSGEMIKKIANLLKYITFSVLSVGLIWCVFLLILGIVVPEQSDYANNMSELIVSVLTVISIIFAFVEFLKRKNDKE